MPPVIAAIVVHAVAAAAAHAIARQVLGRHGQSRPNQDPKTGRNETKENTQ